MPLTNQVRLLPLSRILCGLSVVFLVFRILAFRTMSMWAQLPYDPAHPTPVDDRAITYHTTPFFGWCLNHGYLFFVFFFATLIFMTIVETKSHAPRPGGAANLS
jgi:hypothetical protein